MHVCPQVESLERLLDGELSDQAAAGVGIHVETCAQCQSALERLSGDDELEVLRAARPAFVREVRAEDGCRAALDRMHRSTTLELSAGIARTDSGAALTLPPSTHPGDLGMLGPYRVRSELGRGGMGIVLAAIDPQLDRPVAIKVLRPDRVNDRSRERFVREAQAAARVKHNHVVTVHAVVNPPDAPPFLVMELVAGMTLRDRIALERRIEPRDAAAVAAAVADGLAAAHDAGLVHRDIKPSNVLLEEFESQGTGFSDRRSTDANDETKAKNEHNEPEPQARFLNPEPRTLNPLVKITDFGLVQIAESSAQLTLDGMLAGTPSYMSPEQVRNPSAVDRRTDVYSLGVTLYEALTGEVPFNGTTQMVLRQIELDEPRPPRRLNDRIPRDLETICLKAMAKEPARRYGSAREFGDDLRRWLAGEPIRARPVGSAERFWRWSRRNPRVAGLSGLVAALVLTLMVGSMIAAARISATLRRLNQEREAGVSARVDALVAAAPDAVPLAIDTLRSTPGLALPLLRNRLERETADVSERLHAACGLAALGETHEEFLIDSIATVPTSVGECTNIVNALQGAKRDAVAEQLIARYDGAPHADQRARLATVLLHLGHPSAAQKALAPAEDPTDRTAFVHQFAAWHGDLTVLSDVLRRVPDSALRSGLCVALGLIDPRTVPAIRRQELQALLSELFAASPDAPTHSAASWALRRWGVVLPLIEPAAHESRGRDWFVNRHEVTMLKIRPGTFWMSEPQHHRYLDRTRHQVTITYPYFISDREVWVGLFNQFLNDPNYPAVQKPIPLKRELDREVSPVDECPMQNITWEEAVLFCNWLSLREGRTPCYERVDERRSTKGTDGRSGSEDAHWAEWQCDFEGDGYRLPTDAEWEFACRAGTTTRFSFADDPSLLPLYGVSSNNRKMAALRGRSLLPNAWGLFDMHGNVWEWCWDWFAAYSDAHQTDPRGPDAPDSAYGPVRVYRGGGVANFSGDPDSAARGHGAPGSAAWNLGFRVVCPSRE